MREGQRRDRESRREGGKREKEEIEREQERLGLIDKKEGKKIEQDLQTWTIKTEENG